MGYVYYENISEAEISAFAEELYKDYPLEKTVLRRLIRIYSITGDIFYDLDYDTQLQRAIEIANSKDFYNLFKKNNYSRRISISSNSNIY